MIYMFGPPESSKELKKTKLPVLLLVLKDSSSLVLTKSGHYGLKKSGSFSSLVYNICFVTILFYLYFSKYGTRKKKKRNWTIFTIS